MRITMFVCMAALTVATTASIGQRSGPDKTARARHIPIALQLYSVRDDCAKDLPGVLKAVRRMGYEGVEFAGYHGRTAAELRRMLDVNGLKCCGTHIGLESLLGDEFDKTVVFNKTLGNRFLIVPGLAHERTATRAAWLETARIFNEISKKLEPHKMWVGYHNHNIEFKPLDGQMPWDTFFGSTDKRVVMQFDTGNALTAGADAAPFIQRYPGRALTVHLKEHSATNDKALIGEGDVRWQQVLALLRTVGKSEWYIVEQESYAYPPLECAAKSLKNLQELLHMYGRGSVPAPADGRRSRDGQEGIGRPDRRVIIGEDDPDGA